jgi:hypothetical protein
MRHSNSLPVIDALLYDAVDDAEERRWHQTQRTKQLLISTSESDSESEEERVSDSE